MVDPGRLLGLVVVMKCRLCGGKGEREFTTKNGGRVVVRCVPCGGTGEVQERISIAEFGEMLKQEVGSKE